MTPTSALYQSSHAIFNTHLFLLSFLGGTSCDLFFSKAPTDLSPVANTWVIKIHLLSCIQTLRTSLVIKAWYGLLTCFPAGAQVCFSGSRIRLSYQDALCRILGGSPGSLSMLPWLGVPGCGRKIVNPVALSNTEAA